MRLVILILTSLFFHSCTKTKPHIEFGHDQCFHCMMIIMDKHFGALLVNSKGKMIKFDSDECLLRFLTDDSKFKPVEFYTVNYSKPGNLINAEESFFLFGGSIKSPMGGKLLSVSTDQEANELLSKFKAEKLDWNEFKKISNE